MGKYKRLTRYLEALQSSEARLHFREIEQILGDSLPSSARSYAAWWANDSSGSPKSNAWLSAGFATADLDLRREAVTFRESESFRSRTSTLQRQAGGSDQRVYAELSNLPLADDQPVRLSLEMAWFELGPLSCSDDGVLKIPTAPPCPGLYRFRLITETSARHYIGETANLQRRFASYRNPGPTQATNIRLNRLCRDHFAEGGYAVLDIVSVGITLLIGEAKTHADLHDKNTRRLLENAALVSEGAAAIKSLNR